MWHAIRDLRFAWRGLVHSRGFAAIAVVSIALGIGANTAIFTLVDQVLLRLLPVSHPEQLVLLTSSGSHYGNNRGGNALSFPMYEDFRDNFVAPGPALPRTSAAFAPASTVAPVFSGLFCRYAMSVLVGFAGETERVPGELVSGTYFDVLGVGAALGRVITPDDDRTAGAHPVAVLSYDYWRTRFASDPAIVGRSITVNNYPLTIVGVSQRGFDGLDIGYAPKVRVPVMMKAQMTPQWNDLDNRRSRWVNVFGRLAPDVPIGRAKSALQPFFHNLLEQEVRQPAFSKASAYTREQFLKSTIDALPAAQGRSPLRRQLAQPLWVLMATTAGVLLIACANVASLLIARATSREKEIAIRLALGATRARLVGQLLAESLLLAVIGGALGLAVASWTDRVLLGFLPTSETPHTISASLDGRILAFSAALSLLTGLLFGLVPALRSTRADLAPTLKDQVGSVAGGGAGARVRKALVVAQVTLSILLLVGAGLFVRSLRNLRLVDLGIRPERLIAFNLSPGASGYSPRATKAFDQQLADRLRSQPGVTGAGFAAMGLLEGNEWDSTVTVEGYTPKTGEDMNPYCNAVSPGYFKTLGIPLLAGRDFDLRDQGEFQDERGFGTFRVAIANESFVKRYFGDRNPIGRHIGFGGDPGTKTPIEIVGVVKDAKYTGVRDETPRQLFFPILEDSNGGAVTMYVRTAADPAPAFGAAQRALRELDTKVPMYNQRTLERQIERSLLTERLIATLSTAFGVLATILAVVGLYGVIAYTVARRTREIGVRMALGAASADVLWLVMREVVLLVGAGLMLGMAGAWALGRLVQSQLYGIAPADPVTMIAAAMMLAAVAGAAGFIPARRATRVNPVQALRYE